MSRNLPLAVGLLLELSAAACLDTSGASDTGGLTELVTPTVSEDVELAALPTWPANPNWQSQVLGPSSDDVRPVRARSRRSVAVSSPCHRAYLSIAAL